MKIKDFVKKLTEKERETNKNLIEEILAKEAKIMETSAVSQELVRSLDEETTALYGRVKELYTRLDNTKLLKRNYEQAPTKEVRPEEFYKA